MWGGGGGAVYSDQAVWVDALARVIVLCFTWARHFTPITLFPPPEYKIMGPDKFTAEG